MRLKADELIALLARKGYSAEGPAPVAARIPDPIPQHDAGPESLGAYADEEGSGARAIVRITRCGSRILDADNLAGAKALVDQMRYVGLIPEDNPHAIRLQLCQRKVKRAEVGTLIEIIPLP